MKKIEKATFGMGCFWGSEYIFNQVSGVISTKVGYTGGNLKNPSYDQVCSDKTGHVEVVQIKFDYKKVDYKKLLEIFWKNHDPTTINKQGPDIGTQYKSAIFYHSDKQKKEAKKSKEEFQKRLNKKIVTEILKAKDFYPAEEYHQKYFEKHGQVCHINLDLK